MLAPVKPLREDRPAEFLVRHLPVVPNLQLYQRELKRTNPPAQLVDTYTIGPVSIARIEVNPIQITKQRTLELLTHIEVTLQLKVRRRLSGLAKSRLSTIQHERLLGLVKSIVVNREQVPSIEVFPLSLQESADYLILTDNHTWDPNAITPRDQTDGDLVRSFERLRDWRAQHGLKARIVTVTDIVNNSSGFGDFVTGSKDLQEVIRKFLQWARTAWGLTYVLLGGAQQVLPVRSIATVGWWTGSGTAPTDFYYSSLDPQNNWAENQKIAYQQCSYAIDLSVGRIAVESSSQVDRFVTKVIGYEQQHLTDGLPGTTSYPSRMLLAATPWNWDIRTSITRADSYPPSDNQFYNAAGTSYSVIKLVEKLEVTLVRPANPRENPGPNHYTHVSGDEYSKVQIQDTYNGIQEIVVHSKNGSMHTLNYYEDAGPEKYGWHYNSGTTTFILAYDSPDELEPVKYVVKLQAAFREPQNLLRVDQVNDCHEIPYCPDAAARGIGWYFAKSSSDTSPSPASPSLPGQQVATPWVVAYEATSSFGAPQLSKYLWDPTEKEGSMMDLEKLRKQITREIPRWDTVTRLYIDEVDLPPGTVQRRQSATSIFRGLWMR